MSEKKDKSRDDPQAGELATGDSVTTHADVKDIVAAADVVLSAVPEDVKPQVELLVASAVSIRGPLPPPEYLEGYEKICSGITRQFFDDYFVEKREEAKHRRDLEALALKHDMEVEHTQIAADVDFRKRQGESIGRGQTFALALGLSIVGAGVAISLNADAKAGAWVCVTGVATAVGPFLARLIHPKDGQKLPSTEDEQPPKEVGPIDQQKPAPQQSPKKPKRKKR